MCGVGGTAACEMHPPPRPPKINVERAVWWPSCVANILPVNIEIGGTGDLRERLFAGFVVLFLQPVYKHTGNINDFDRLPCLAAEAKNLKPKQKNLAAPQSFNIELGGEG